MTGRKVGPALLLIFIEAAEERHEAIEGAKFRECNRTVRHIDHAGIVLAHYVEHTDSSLIEITPTRIARIGKEVDLDGAASRPDELEPEIVPREERTCGGSGDRQAYLICRELDRSRYRHIAAAGYQNQEQTNQTPCRIHPNHLFVGTFGAAPIASNPA